MVKSHPSVKSRVRDDYKLDYCDVTDEEDILWSVACLEPAIKRADITMEGILQGERGSKMTVDLAWIL